MLAIAFDDWLCSVIAQCNCSAHAPNTTPKTKTSIPVSTDSRAETTDAVRLWGARVCPSSFLLFGRADYGYVKISNLLWIPVD
jgi:hypothetical protein